MSSTVEKARGRWIEILTQFGVDASCLDGKHHPCPNCGGSDRFRFDDQNGSGSHICSQCGAGDGIDLISKMMGYPDFKTTAQAIDDAMGWSAEPLSDADKQAYRKKREQQNIERANAEKQACKIAAKQCLERWEGASIAKETHPYLKAKGVQAHGIKQQGDDLLVPVRIDNEITSIQQIGSDGKKQFSSGGKVGGGYFRITPKDVKNIDTVVVCEGYATGASIYEATGYAVAVAFNASNLVKVACILRAKVPKAKIIIAADNDTHRTCAACRATTTLETETCTQCHQPHLAKNVGLESANKAAQAVGGVVALPKWDKPRSVDLNDLHSEYNLSVVAALIDNAKLAEPMPTQVQMDELESSPPLPKVEWGQPKPLVNNLLPVQPFDLDLLPDAFRDYALDISHSMQSPIDFVAVSLMTSLGAVVGNRCGIHPKAVNDWLVYPNVWGSLVGRPTSKKSPSLKGGLCGIYALDNNEAKAVEDANKCLSVRQAIYKAKLKTFTKVCEEASEKEKLSDDDMEKLMNQKPEEPEAAHARQFIVNAITVEKFVNILAKNQDGILQFRDELVGWIRNMENPCSQDARTIYIEAWDGDKAFKYDTVTHGKLIIDKLCISVLGGIQPPLLAALVRDTQEGTAGDDGLLQRFQLMVYPDPIMDWQYVDKKPNKVALKKVIEVFKQAAGQSGKARFTDDAQQVFVAWYSKNEKDCKLEQSPCLESHFGKYAKLMPSLALLIHIADCAIKTPDKMLTKVSEEATRKAVKWCEYLETHARRIYSMGESAGMDAAKKIIDLVVDNKIPDTFSIGELQRKNLAGLKGEQAKQAMELLEAYGWAISSTEKHATGGRPSISYKLHPQVKKHADYRLPPLTLLTKPNKKEFSEFSEGGSQRKSVISSPPPRSGNDDFFADTDDVGGGVFAM